MIGLDNIRKIRAQSSFMVVALGFAALVSCGMDDSEMPDNDSSDEGSTTIINSAGQSQSKLISIPVNLTNAYGTTSFSLADPATSYSVQLESCISGYTVTVTDANTDGLEVYKHDRGCLAKLTQFAFGGKTYIPTAGDPFTTWQVGDTAIFDESGEPGTVPLKVIVVSTLGDPITGVEAISYGFSENLTGNDKGILWSTVGSSAQITVSSVAPPSFTVKSVELTDLSATAAGQFKFVMECTATIGVTDVCETVTMSDLDYKLVKDTYSSSVSQAEADTIFGTAGTSVTLPTDRVAPGDSGTTNGGFMTVVTDGPDDLADFPNIILIIRSNTTSYQYFNIDTTVTTTY